jgi:REP element-mobilizing transposase RayT
MPRPPRIDFPDAVYHVTSRGNGRAKIFHSDDDRGRFLDQLAHHLHLCAVDLYAFVLMDNHFHLLCRTPRANLSRFMQRLLSSYALYWRYKHRRPGHLFQGRFKAKLVEDEVYLQAVTRYIHLNPVKIAACRPLIASQRLERLDAYAWSSYGGYVAANKALDFVNYEVLKEYGRNMTAARRHYRAYVRACLMDDDSPLLEAMAASRYAIGGSAFLERTEERIEQRRSGRLQDQDLDLPRRVVPLEEIDEAVSRHYGIDPALFSAHGRRVGAAKSVAVELAAQLADLSGREIGKHYGMCATAVGANRRRLATRSEVLQVIEILGRKLRKQN